MLKSTLTAFHAVKHLCSGFQVVALWPLRPNTLVLCEYWNCLSVLAESHSRHFQAAKKLQIEVLTLARFNVFAYSAGLKLFPYPTIICVLQRRLDKSIVQRN
jgi:hypothetical protein